MDQFEAARLKTAQREERKHRYAEQSVSNNVPEVPLVVNSPKVLKEKPQKNGIFTISVDMPHTQFTFSLVKQSILSHASSNRLTEDEIRKHIIQGLKPLLGGLD
jgi:hypothetical protein